jgi:hypothetical protein
MLVYRVFENCYYKKILVIGDGELKSSAKIFFNKSPLVFEIKITKNWVKIVSTIVSCQNLAKKYLFFILLYSPSLSRLVTKV